MRKAGRNQGERQAQEATLARTKMHRGMFLTWAASSRLQYQERFLDGLVRGQEVRISASQTL